MQMIRVGLLLALLLTAPLGRADWINLTGSETAPNIAEIYVMDDHVRLVFEVYIDDLEKFTELVPDAWLSETDVRVACDASPHLGIGGGVYSFHLPSVTNFDGSFWSERGALT
jgi:hypothetical protein